MELYRITNDNHSKTLTVPGLAARWNKPNEFVLYAASTRSLASLELKVHESGVKSSDLFTLMIVSLADDKDLITTVSVNQLPENWRSIRAVPFLQKIGSDWYQNKKSLILEVPSVIVAKENNFLINMNHPDFKTKISIRCLEEVY